MKRVGQPMPEAHEVEGTPAPGGSGMARVSSISWGKDSKGRPLLGAPGVDKTGRCEQMSKVFNPKKHRRVEMNRQTPFLSN